MVASNQMYQTSLHVSLRNHVYTHSVGYMKLDSYQYVVVICHHKKFHSSPEIRN